MLKSFIVVLGFLMIHSSSHATENGVIGKSYSTKNYGHIHAKGHKKTESAQSRMRAFPRLSFLKANFPIPKSTDLSAQVSPPMDQGQCGCCWDFSLTKALRSEYMLKSKDPGVLEFNYLLNNCGPGPKMNGCNGGDFTAAQNFESSHGPGLNNLDPFTGLDGGRCKKLAVQATAMSYSLLGEGDQPPTFKDLAYAIGVARHVLSIDVAAASGDWESYSGGIYNDCHGTAADIDHMVNAVAYDCETSVDTAGNCVFDSKGAPVKGDGWILVMNNWGNSWGTSDVAAKHGGYMKTRLYDTNGNHCNAVATDALFFEIDTSKQPNSPECVGGFLCGKSNCKMPWCKKQ